MKDVRELITLYSYVGTNNPYWRLSEDCNILHFSVDAARQSKRDTLTTNIGSRL